MKLKMRDYEKDYHKFVHKNLLVNKSYYLFRAKYADKIYWKYLKGKVLEFGSGLGQNIFLHKDIAEGIDISDFSIDFCKRKGIKVTKDIKKIKSNSFDSILIIHCLEHLENPLYFLKEFYRILKPSGILLLILPSPNKNKPFKKLKRDVGKHLYNWNFSEINQLVNLAKFEIKLNKFNYAYGFSSFYKLPFNIALFLLKYIAIIKNKKEMIILAKK